MTRPPRVRPLLRRCRTLQATGSDSTKAGAMATLVAIGYDDETTAFEAAHEVERLTEMRVIAPGAIAKVRRGLDGKIHVDSENKGVSGGAYWGMFWGVMFGMLFTVPVIGLVVGAG